MYFINDILDLILCVFHGILLVKGLSSDCMVLSLLECHFQVVKPFIVNTDGVHANFTK